MLLALVGGLGGWALLQALTTKMSSVFEAAVGNSVKAASEAAEKKVLEMAGPAGVDADKKQDLAKQAADAALQAGSTALQAEPAPAPGP